MCKKTLCLKGSSRNQYDVVVYVCVKIFDYFLNWVWLAGLDFCSPWLFWLPPLKHVHEWFSRCLGIMRQYHYVMAVEATWYRKFKIRTRLCSRFLLEKESDLRPPHLGDEAMFKMMLNYVCVLQGHSHGGIFQVMLMWASFYKPHCKAGECKNLLSPLQQANWDAQLFQ